jgi:hypothetical protein
MSYAHAHFLSFFTEFYRGKEVLLGMSSYFFAQSSYFEGKIDLLLLLDRGNPESSTPGENCGLRGR